MKWYLETMITATSPRGGLRHPVLAGATLSILMMGYALAGERTVPPPLDKMAPELRQIEDFFRKGKWKESLDQLERIESSLQDLALPIEKVVGIAKMDEVSFALEDVRGALRERNLTRTETAYRKFEKIYLDVCERFPFQIPPSVQLVQMNIEAADKARSEGDMASAARNLWVAYDLLPWMEEILGRIRVEAGRMRAFRATVLEARLAADRGDREGMTRPVKAALDMLPEFIFMTLKAATPGNGPGEGNGNHP